MLTRTIALIFVLSLLVACMPPTKTYTMQTPFRYEDWQQGAKSGSCTLKGQAFLKTRGGDVKTCAGSKVILMPYNAYTSEMFGYMKGGGNYKFTNLDERLARYSKMTICDAEGDFIFENLSTGRWLILSEVTWEIPMKYSSRYP